MELEGLKRSLAILEDAEIHLTDITTDRHVQVRKYLCENKTELNHWFDCWHVAKSKIFGFTVVIKSVYSLININVSQKHADKP